MTFSLVDALPIRKDWLYLLYNPKTNKMKEKRRLEILSEPHQLVISTLVIGGIIVFAVYGLVINVFN